MFSVEMSVNFPFLSIFHIFFRFMGNFVISLVTYPETKIVNEIFIM